MVAVNVGVHRRVLHRVADRHLLDRVVVGVPERQCRGDAQRVPRRSEQRVGAVDLVAAGAAEHEAEVSDDLVVADPLICKAHPRVVARLEALVPRGFADPVGDKADPDEPLRRQPAITPQASELAGRLVVVLSR